MNFNKNDLMDAVNIRFFESFSLTLDKSGFVPDDFMIEIEDYIFKNMKKQWKKIDKEDKRYQKSLRPRPWWKRLFDRIFRRFEFIGRRKRAAADEPPQEEPAPQEKLPAEVQVKEVSDNAK